MLRAGEILRQAVAVFDLSGGKIVDANTLESILNMAEEQPVPSETTHGKDPEINKYFRAAIKTLASDVHLKVGQPPKLRLYGYLKSTTGGPLTEERIEKLVFEILSPAHKKFFDEHGTLDFAHEVDGDHRFRVNIFRQRGMVSLAARRVNTTIPPFEDLHLPPILERISESTQGLVLVVGPTGCGKTTTIASMIDHINRTRSCHIVTVEDPIEYLFKDAKAIVSQREIGLDVIDFSEALTYLMRQDPDVVFVGEMRDAKTVTAGMRAAETGHLVFGTMHSANASQSVHRLLDLFPQGERDLVRQTLALALRAVVSQVLIPCLKEKIDRIPAVEVLIANAAARKLISEGREADLPSVIRASQQEGMQDVTFNLCEMVKNGFIDPKEAYKFAPNTEELKMALKGIRTTASGIL
ncbi:MAG: PilT/PilU family type 4a pilus ATPase [Phycisphaerae bacterium]|nr:PilT/PilU family type 4a pilus ATPase [Phycisphaerae bacterium]